MEQIEAQDIAWHPASYADAVGRVFTWRGALYRAIAPTSAAHIRALLGSERIRMLQARGALIGAEEAPIAVAGAAFVLRHPHIPFVTYRHEWVPAAAHAYVDPGLGGWVSQAAYLVFVGILGVVVTPILLFGKRIPRPLRRLHRRKPETLSEQSKDNDRSA